MILDGIATEDCQYFLDLVNRGGLMKPSDIVFAVCCVAWEVYARIMESYDAKSYFLACKMQRKVFIKSVLIETRSHYTYSSILETSCLQDHPFENIFVNIVTKLFNVMCKKFASEVNSAVHKDKKRMNKQTNISPRSIKIRKLQSEK